jgi:oxygen-dependent protoporphyrinogen oxidase
VPPIDGRVIKAATFTTNKWPWYADTHGEVAIARASIGRFHEEGDLQRSDEDLIEVTRGELADATGVTATPLDALVTRWGGALPQYMVGHRARVERVRQAVASVPGLAVCGATYDGVGIPACISSAGRAASELLEQWTHA